MFFIVDVFDGFMEKIYSLLLLIDTKLYSFVTTLFTLFLDLANTEIFKSDIIKEFGSRIYVIVGVIALFLVTYNLLLSIVDPDKLQKNSFKFIKNFVTSLVIIILLPSIFDFAYKVQNVILTDGIIAKIFLSNERGEQTIEIEIQDGDDIKTETITYEVTSVHSLKTRAGGLAWNVLNAFLYVVDEDGDKITVDYSPVGKWETLASAGAVFTCGKAILAVGSYALTQIPTAASPIPGDEVAIAGTLGRNAAVSVVKCGASLAVKFGLNGAFVLTKDTVSWGAARMYAAQGEFDLLSAFAPAIQDGRVSYTPIISTICAFILLYVIFSFCLDLGIRAVKLAFYQLMAPIPILLRILPNNDKIFSNWLKVTFATYMEVFIRLVVIYLVVFFASHVGDLQIGSLTNLAKAIVILGLVTFAKQLPKLLSEITGIDSGNMKLGIMEKLGAGGALAVGALAGGALLGGLRSGVNSWKNSRGQHWTKRVAGTAKSSMSGAASSGFRSAKGAGFKAKSFGDVWNASKTGSKEAYEKAQAKKKYKANHPGFAGVARGKAADLWNDLIYDDELKGYNDRIKTVQDFDIQKKVNDWVASNDSATKEAESALKNFESRKLSDSEMIEAERKRLESLIRDNNISERDKAIYRGALKKINTNDAHMIQTIKNSYMAKYWKEHEKLKDARNAVRDKAVERYANTTGSEIQEMIIEANKIRNANKSDALFNGSKNIEFGSVVADLKANHNAIAGKDNSKRDVYGNIILDSVGHTPGTVEQMRGSEEYRRAFSRYKEKVEKEGKK